MMKVAAEFAWSTKARHFFLLRTGVRNVTAGNLGEAIVIAFAVIKAVTACERFGAHHGSRLGCTGQL
jgi:hypothetical protein